MDQNLTQQLGAHAEYLSAFIPRFFDHIDFESHQVRGKIVPYRIF
jgi:hypothetical protein